MKKYITILAAIALGLPALAQNLNPTVEVTNQFKGKTVEVNKPVQEMFVPDTLMRFDLKFDYSVFDQKYAGAGDFSPYLMDMTPQPQFVEKSKFFLRAGAGYTLHPTLDLIYSPWLNNGLQLNVYAKNRSYIGDYIVFGTEDFFKGYNLLSEAGVNGKKAWERFCLDFSAGYSGIHTSHTYSQTGMNAATASVKLGSFQDNFSKYAYRGSVDLLVGADRYTAALGGVGSVGMFEIGMAAGVDRIFSPSQRFVVDFKANVNSYSGVTPCTASLFSLNPKYVYNKERFHAAAGLLFSIPVGGYKGHYVYPSFYLDYDLVPKFLNVYAVVGGGDQIKSYSSLKQWNYFISELNLDNTSNRINFNLGFRGNVASFFKFNANAGFVTIERGLLNSVDQDMLKSDGLYLPTYVYEDVNLFYGTAKLVWDKDPVLAEVGAEFSYGIPTQSNCVGIPPTPLAVYTKVRYNWNKRIYAGVYLERVEKRLIGNGWYDLGIEAEYLVTKKLSVWVKGSNLLNQTIQRNIGYAERGVNVTGGIILNL